MTTFLRQLSSGLSVYRRFPGDPGRGDFAEAVRRVESAAEVVLRWGPVDLEVVGGRFLGGHGPVEGDDRVERLALALYRHRAQRLVVRGVPRRGDLAALYEALSRPPSEGEGVGEALRRAGVSTLVVETLAPGSPGAEDHPTPEQRELWERLAEPGPEAARLVATAGPGSPAEVAAAVVEAIGHLAALLPERHFPPTEAHRRFRRLLAHLPTPLRRAAFEVLLDRVEGDGLAGGLIGTMTDAELARLLVDLGGQGRRDPVRRARRLVEVGARRLDLVQLTTALVMGQVDAGTIVPDLHGVGIGEDAAGPVVAGTVSSLLARGLLRTGEEDVRWIREEFPGSEEAARAVALDALRDYLRLETDPDRLGEVLAAWVTTTSEAIRRRDEPLVAALAEALQGLTESSAGRDRRSLARDCLDRVLKGAVLRQLTASSAGVEETARLLGHFGAVAVERLLDEASEEEDRGRRAQLLAVLAPLARGYLDLVGERITDPRWHVAHTAVTVLARSGGRKAVSVLSRAARHPDPQVRREAVRGLVEAGGLGALDVLLAAASDPDRGVRAAVVSSVAALTAPGACRALARVAVALRDGAERRAALEALAQHPSPEALSALEALRSGRDRPRLPWRFRRLAGTLAARRRRSAP